MWRAGGACVMKRPEIGLRRRSYVILVIDFRVPYHTATLKCQWDCDSLGFGFLTGYFVRFASSS